MQDGALFDNILIASDEKVAESYREKTWKPKYEVEKEKQNEEEKAAGLSDGLSGIQKKVFDVLYKVADIPFLEAYMIKIIVPPAKPTVETKSADATETTDAAGSSVEKEENEKEDAAAPRPRRTRGET